MRCTHFLGQMERMKLQAIKELEDALKAHGGEYMFFDCDQEDAQNAWCEWWDECDGDTNIPKVVGFNSYDVGIYGYYVTRIKLENDEIVIFGIYHDKEDVTQEQQIFVETAADYQTIIEHLPDTEGIHDVRSLPQLTSVCLMSLERDDIKTIGYDSDISDDQLQNVANTMQKGLDMENFWMALEDACEINNLNKTDNNEQE